MGDGDLLKLLYTPNGQTPGKIPGGNFDDNNGGDNEVQYDKDVETFLKTLNNKQQEIIRATLKMVNFDGAADGENDRKQIHFIKVMILGNGNKLKEALHKKFLRALAKGKGRRVKNEDAKEQLKELLLKYEIHLPNHQEGAVLKSINIGKYLSSSQCKNVRPHGRLSKIEKKILSIKQQQKHFGIELKKLQHVQQQQDDDEEEIWT